MALIVDCIININAHHYTESKIENELALETNWDAQFFPQDIWLLITATFTSSNVNQSITSFTSKTFTLINVTLTPL